MGRGILKALIGYLDKAAKKPPGCREAGNGLNYILSDAIRSALTADFSPLLFPASFTPELPAGNAAKDETEQPGNPVWDKQDTLHGAGQIKNIVDDIEPGTLTGAFEEGPRLTDEQEVLKEYRALAGITDYHAGRAHEKSSWDRYRSFRLIGKARLE
jgi:hypothetical protein